MDRFKNIHKDKECVILTCGPSLTEYPKEIIEKFLKDKIIICVKESIIEYKNKADYFISNCTRDRVFNFNERTIKIFQSKPKQKSKNKVDVTIEEDFPFLHKNQILRTHNFEKYNFDNFIKRPWGPGILYETVFYLSLFMGFKNVYTIGWDLIDTQNECKITHYFEDYTSNEYKNSLLWKERNFKEEMQLVNDNIPYFYDYFKGKGMNIFVVGEKSFVNKHIPRICL